MALKRFLILVLIFGQNFNLIAQNTTEKAEHKTIETGAEQLSDYLPFLENKKIAIVGNQTSLIHKTHLVDSLLNLELNIVKVFSPEHGFRGKADAGEKVSSSVDIKTNLPIVSLYGDNKKPSQEQLKGVEVIVFDIQDVGVRFYTYISTLHYVMEAAAEAKIPVIVLDRPNPNGHYIDGPVLDTNFRSFIGMHPVPVVYGVTIGEYAQMINGEHWLKDSLICDLKVIPLKNYTHSSTYSLPVAPSPNLKTNASIQFYPSLCLFEGTIVSVGRGTETPFETFGHPDFPNDLYSFTPKPMEGSKTPLLMNKVCYGYQLSSQAERMNRFSLEYIMTAQKFIGAEKLYDNPRFFNLLAGNNVLIEQLKRGMNEEEIRATWDDGLEEFKKIRKKYLIYN